MAIIVTDEDCEREDYLDSKYARCALCDELIIGEDKTTADVYCSTSCEWDADQNR